MDLLRWKCCGGIIVLLCAVKALLRLLSAVGASLCLSALRREIINDQRTKIRRRTDRYESRVTTGDDAVMTSAYRWRKLDLGSLLPLDALEAPRKIT